MPLVSQVAALGQYGRLASKSSDHIPSASTDQSSRKTTATEEQRENPDGDHPVRVDFKQFQFWSVSSLLKILQESPQTSTDQVQVLREKRRKNTDR